MLENVCELTSDRFGGHFGSFLVILGVVFRGSDRHLAHVVISAVIDLSSVLKAHSFTKVPSNLKKLFFFRGEAEKTFFFGNKYFLLNLNLPKKNLEKVFFY